MTNRQILMADDDADDRFLVQAAFEDNNIVNPIVFFEDGELLLDHMSKCEPDTQPLMIILDLNMPKKDGREILQVLRSDSAWKAIPVIIFSTSNAPDDISSAYQLGANCYIIKPSSYEGLKNVIMNVQQFWLHTVAMP